MSRPHIAISMGDPAGVGPELICRLCADVELSQRASITVYGSKTIFQRVSEALNIPAPHHIVECCGDIDDDLKTLQPGALSQTAGSAAIASLQAACDACLADEQQALVTAPLNKEAAQLAGFPHPGHTEFLASHCSANGKTPLRVAMAMHGPTLTVALVTTHCSVAEAAATLSRTEIVRVGKLLASSLGQRLGRAPRLACLGLNPHAGEGGLFGHEDAQIIAPAISDLQAEGISCDGPLAADTAFIPTVRQRYDGIICCYHDQGLIPFKMLHFKDGVNWTLGLPIIRTSPDHGTAFDLAWQNKAQVDSLKSAMDLAIKLAAHKRSKQSVV